MKLKEYIKTLSAYDPNLIVTYADDCCVDGIIYVKEHNHMTVGNLETNDVGLGPIVVFKPNEKGKFLCIDLVSTEVFDNSDLCTKRL